MYAGKLRFPIKLQRNHPVKNELGEPLDDWQDYADTDADIKPLQGREFYDAQQINAELTTVVTIRWLPDVRADDRVVYGDRILTIVWVRNIDSRDHALDLVCKENPAPAS